MALAYRADIFHARQVIKGTCFTIKVVSSLYLKCPSMEEWQNISGDYWKMCNMPNCLSSFADMFKYKLQPAQEVNTSIIKKI